MDLTVPAHPLLEVDIPMPARPTATRLTGTARDENAATDPFERPAGAVPAAALPMIDGRVLPPMPDPDAAAVVRRAISGQTRRVVPAALFSMLHQACEAAVPVLIGIGVDQAIARQSPTALVVTLIALVVLFAVLTVAQRMGGRLVRRATQGAAHEMRVRISARALDPRGTEPGAVRSGALLSTATSDAQRVGLVNASIWAGGGALAALVVGAVLVLRTSWLLGLVVVLGLIPVVLLSALVSRPLVRRSAVEQSAAAAAADTAADLLSGLRVLKGLGAETVASARYAAASVASRDAAIRAAVVTAARTAAVTALTGAFLAVVAYLGAVLALSGSITIGAFISAMGLTQFLLGPFTWIAAVGAQVARARASARRIADVLTAPTAVHLGSGGPDPFATDPFATDPFATDPFATEALGLSVQDAAREGSDPLDLTVTAGEIVGIVTQDAPARAAVNVLLQCLAREADPEAGTLRLGGVDVTDLEPDVVRRHALVARHDAVLFTGTLAANLGAAVPGRDAEMVSRAVHAAAADQVAEVIRGGTDAVLTERGRSLSGGQRQRVALARALAEDSDVLVLDDPTSAVDSVTEAQIAERLAHLRSGRTTLVVTTSPALLATTDRVVVLAGGRVRAQGTHAELVTTDADYRELVLR